MVELSLLRAGQAAGSSTLKAEDLATIARSYDPAIHEAPVAIGEVRHDAPAFAWVKALAVRDGALVADLDQVDPALAELVREGRFGKLAVSLYRPNAPSNPKPGTWHLRHVGFLGAPRPAVTGLRPVQLADAGAGVVELAAPARAVSAAAAGRLRAVAAALGFNMPEQQAEQELVEKFGHSGPEGEADEILAAAEARGIDPAELRRQALRYRTRSRDVGLRLTTVEAAYAVAHGVPGLFALEDWWEGRDPHRRARAVRSFQEAAAAFGETVDFAEAVTRLRMLDPDHRVRLALELQDAARAAGVRITTAEAVDRVWQGVAERDIARFAEMVQAHQQRESERNARAAQALQDRMKALGVHVSTIDAVDQVRRERERGPARVIVPEHTARAARACQDKRRQGGVVISFAEAVRQVTEL